MTDEEGYPTAEELAAAGGVPITFLLIGRVRETLKSMVMDESFIGLSIDNLKKQMLYEAYRGNPKANINLEKCVHM